MLFVILGVMLGVILGLRFNFPVRCHLDCYSVSQVGYQFACHVGWHVGNQLGCHLRMTGWVSS